MTVVSVITADLSYCVIGSSFSCDVVISSVYSSVLGIPVALVGAVGFGLLFVISYVALVSDDEPPALLPAAAALSIVGLAFGAYLTYLEIFVIGAICLLCLAATLLVLPLVFLGARGLLVRRATG